MREIKFRAWDKLKKSVHEVAGINFVEGIVLLWKQTGTARQTYAVEVDSIELMQYTGLHDKNGKEIYEGDIVRIDDIVGEYKWVDDFACFAVPTDSIKHNSYIYPQRIDEHSMEVIGNIYENPDLKGEK